MRIKILAIGKNKNKQLLPLIDEYIKRNSWSVQIVELEERKKLPPHQLMLSEASMLMSKCSDGDFVIALDERGQNISSDDFAKILKNARQQKTKDIVFVIGGAHGLSDAVRDRADICLSFGKLTWPHMLIRVMLAEQLYRANSIISGHPYHK